MVYTYRTTKGPFHIVQRGDRWHIIFDDDSLGSYHSPQAAASDLSGGHTFSPGLGIDPAKLDIPEDLGEWERSTGGTWTR